VGIKQWGAKVITYLHLVLRVRMCCAASWRRFLVSRSFHVSLATAPELDLPVPFLGSSSPSGMACFPEFSYLSSVLSSSLYDLHPCNQRLNSVLVLLLQNHVSANIKVVGGCAAHGGAGIYLGFCVLHQYPQVYMYV
jgi:hypothetical protein